MCLIAEVTLSPDLKALSPAHNQAVPPVSDVRMFESTLQEAGKAVETENHIDMYAPAEHIYRLAAYIEKWPGILPHYRWATLFRDDGRERPAEMAATRDGLPVTWTSIETLDLVNHRIRFRHCEALLLAWTSKGSSIKR